jgi:CRP-like cAMP-binding protein
VEELPHEVRSVAKGTRLIRAGETQDHCYVVLSALAQKVKYSGDLRRVVAINLPGEIVNAEAVLALASDYSAEVFRAGELAVIPASAIRGLVFSFPPLARALWLRSQAEAAIYREWLLNDSRGDLRTRMAHLLAETAARLEFVNAGAGAEPIVPLDAASLPGPSALLPSTSSARWSRFTTTVPSPSARKACW